MLAYNVVRKDVGNHKVIESYGFYVSNEKAEEVRRRELKKFPYGGEDYISIITVFIHED